MTRDQGCATFGLLCRTLPDSGDALKGMQSGAIRDIPFPTFMTKPQILAFFAGAWLIAIPGTSLRGGDAAPAAVRAVFERHCLKCHSGEEPKGDLTLEPLLHDAGDKKAALALWTIVLEKLET